MASSSPRRSCDGWFRPVCKHSVAKIPCGAASAVRAVAAIRLRRDMVIVSPPSARSQKACDRRNADVEQGNYCTLLNCIRSQTSQPESAPTAPPRTALRTWFAGRFTGDFDAMLDRRLIRLVVPYSLTLFFEDKGTIYGTAANGAQLFEDWINKALALRARRLTVPLTPVSRDKLFDALLAGDGDIAAGDITITEELRKNVAFSVPFISNVREIVITGEDVPELAGRAGDGDLRARERLGGVAITRA
jgi:ABC-type amino acid transport substrate-binding protein